MLNYKKIISAWGEAVGVEASFFAVCPRAFCPAPGRAGAVPDHQAEVGRTLPPTFWPAACAVEGHESAVAKIWV
jgi:hypothetical protein